MSLAWTTVAIVAFLLPGITFIFGLTIRDRYPHEILRTGPLGELGIAVVAALLFHLIFLSGLGAIGWLETDDAIADAQAIIGGRPWAAGMSAGTLLMRWTAYTLLASGVTALIGWLLGYLIVRGPLSFLGTHRWIGDLIRGDGGVVTAYVMTKVRTETKVTMYQGTLKDFYLSKEGRFSYVALANAYRYAIDLSVEDSDGISEKKALFDKDKGRKWNYLVLEGDEISNITFDKMPKVPETKDPATTDKKLAAEMKASEEALRERKKQTPTVPVAVTQPAENPIPDPTRKS